MAMVHDYGARFRFTVTVEFVTMAFQTVVTAASSDHARVLAVMLARDAHPDLAHDIVTVLITLKPQHHPPTENEQ